MSRSLTLPQEIDLLIVGGGNLRRGAGWNRRTRHRSSRGLARGRTGLRTALGWTLARRATWTPGGLPARTTGATAVWRTRPITSRPPSIALASSAAARPTMAASPCSDTGATTTIGPSSATTGWSWPEVAPAFTRAKQALRVRIAGRRRADAISVRLRRWRRSEPVSHGSTDLNDPEDTAGVSPSPANIYDGTRWNTSLAYLDPVRMRPNLTIVGNATVDRVELRAGRAVAVEAIVDGSPVRIPARRIVLSSGAYGSTVDPASLGDRPGRRSDAARHRAGPFAAGRWPRRWRTTRRYRFHSAVTRSMMRCARSRRRTGCPTNRRSPRRAAVSAERHSTCTSTR